MNHVTMSVAYGVLLTRQEFLKIASNYPIDSSCNDFKMMINDINSHLSVTSHEGVQFAHAGHSSSHDHDQVLIVANSTLTSMNYRKDIIGDIGSHVTSLGNLLPSRSEIEEIIVFIGKNKLMGKPQIHFYSDVYVQKGDRGA